MLVILFVVAAVWLVILVTCLRQSIVFSPMTRWESEKQRWFYVQPGEKEAKVEPFQTLPGLEFLIPLLQLYNDII